MTGGAFGRKGSVGGAGLAARRAAFLAEERARPQGRDRAPVANPALVREKSVGTAYLLWFFLGGFSAHRFYLGFSTSAAVQVALLPISWALIASGSLAAFLTMAASALWLLADAFLIPGLRTEANARLRRNAAFA
jgi:TM2 domain-containing membrane protein YozV